MPKASGIEWATGKNSAVMLPKSKTEPVPGLNHLGVEDSRFFQSPADQSQGERRGVDRRLELGNQEAQRANVVLVPMRDQVSAQLVATFQYVCGVGNDVIDAVHVVGGEEQPGVDDDHVIGGLVDHHVAADFAQAAERHDP